MSHFVSAKRALHRATPWLVSAGLLAVACAPRDATDGERSGLDLGDAGDASDADGADVGGDALEAGSGDADAAVESGAVDATDAAPGDGDAESGADGDADAAPPVSTRCGDGVRGADEECDEGAASLDPDAGDAGDAVEAGIAPRRLCSSTCRVMDALALAPLVDAGPSPASRTLGLGRHPLAGFGGAFAVAFVEPDATPTRVSLTTFDAHGVASDHVAPFGAGSSTVLAANPVLGAFDDGTYAAAWTDFDGDGDELGIALRVVDPAAPSSTMPLHANVTTAFSQYDPDLLVVGAQVVVAWVDDSNAITGPDVKVRTFDRHLVPMRGESAIASTTASEADVALAPFAGTWAIAWKSASAGLESLGVKTGSTQWQTETYLPGPSTSRPALAQLDATHLLLVFASASPDDVDAGTTGGYEIRAAVLDTAAPGAVTSLAAPPTPGGSAADRRDPNLVVAGGKMFLAWRSLGVSGDPQGDESWLKEIGWTGSALTLTATEVVWARLAEHRLGDQRHPALLGVPIPGGEALVGAWDDLGKTFGVGEGNGDVVIEKAPVPVLRLGGS